MARVLFYMSIYYVTFETLGFSMEIFSRSMNIIYQETYMYCTCRRGRRNIPPRAIGKIRIVINDCTIESTMFLTLSKKIPVSCGKIAPRVD